MIYSSAPSVRLKLMSNAIPRQRRPHADRSQSLIAAPSERSEDMRPSGSFLAMLLSLILLVGLAACGPASSDNASSLESRGSVSGPPLSKQNPSPGSNSLPPLPQAASPVPLASGNGSGVASGKGTVPGGNTVRQGDKLPLNPDNPSDVEAAGRDKLPVPGIPNAIAKGLESPDARERLQALDHWEKKGSKAPLDPVFEAFEDENEAVRAKATAIIEQQWAIERERERG
jgi:hypothetical protein